MILGGMPDIGLLILRLALAWVFIYHGAKKLPNKMGGFMAFIGVCEVLGGLAVLFGVLTEWAALGLAILMLGATYKKMTEWKTPFTAMDKTGWEFDMVLFAAAICLVLTGPGKYALGPMLGWS
jgi:putative oxidoreductase